MKNEFLAKRKIFRFSVIFILVLPILIFLHTGFLTYSFSENLQAVIFALSFSFVVVWPIYRKYFFLISLILILVMGLLFIFNIIEMASLAGSTSIGLLIVLLLTYLPDLVKKGFIEKL